MSKNKIFKIIFNQITFFFNFLYFWKNYSNIPKLEKIQQDLNLNMVEFNLEKANNKRKKMSRDFNNKE
jgi:hypothetical protein